MQVGYDLKKKCALSDERKIAETCCLENNALLALEFSNSLKYNDTFGIL